MDKYDAVKAASEALAILLATTACGAATPANPNSLPRQNNSAPSNTQPEPAMYVGIGARCTLYRMNQHEPIGNVFDPVMMGDRSSALGPDGKPYIYSCTDASLSVPVTKCLINPSKGSLTCTRQDGKGTIDGSKTTEPIHGYSRPTNDQQSTYRQFRGAGWSASRHN